MKRNPDEIRHGTSPGVTSVGSSGWAPAEDSERRLTSAEIADLKRALAGPSNAGSLSRVVSHIVTTMVESLESLRDPGSLRADSRGQREARTRRVSRLAAEWGIVMQRAVELPGDQWPEGVAGPEVLASALSEIRSPRENTVGTS